MRRKHSPKIIKLLSDIENLDVEIFNQEVWRSDSGSTLNGQEMGTGLLYLNKRPSPEEVDKLIEAYDNGDLELHGNQIWGAGSKIYFPREKDNSIKLKHIKKASEILKDEALRPMEKAKRIMNIPGFGPNIGTGLVMVFHPNEFAIYNKQSIEALTKYVGYDASSLEQFQKSVHRLKEELGAEDFLELDWFLYILNQEGLPPPKEKSIWWVNQGASLSAELKDSFIWAPLKSKDGKSIYHWDTLKEIQKEDIILHYANGYLRYVSVAETTATIEKKPHSLESHDWEEDGRIVRVRYHELDPPISLVKFNQNVLKLNIEHGPIDTTGGIKQGYLFRFNESALLTIQNSQKETRWPDFAKVWSTDKLTAMGTEDKSSKGDKKDIELSVRSWSRPEN